MEFKKQHLTEIIEEISNKIDVLQVKIIDQQKIISNLELENNNLEKKQQETKKTIKSYLEELKEIREYYANSKDKNS